MAGGWFSAHAIVMPQSLHEHFIWFRSFVLFLLQLFFFCCSAPETLTALLRDMNFNAGSESEPLLLNVSRRRIRVLSFHIHGSNSCPPKRTFFVFFCFEFHTAFKGAFNCCKLK